MNKKKSNEDIIIDTVNISAPYRFLCTKFVILLAAKFNTIIIVSNFIF